MKDVGQRRRRLLWMVSKQCNHHRWGSLSTISSSRGHSSRKKTEKTTSTDFAAWCCPLSHWGYSWALLGNYSTSPLFSWSCFIRFPSSPLSVEQPSRNLLGNDSFMIQNWFGEFSTFKPPDFCEHGIEKLADRWEAIVKQWRQYNLLINIFC